MAQSQNSLPGSPQQVPGLPENTETFDFAGWEGIDTKPSRSGVDDKHAFWLENLMPLGSNNIRALPDRGPALYTAPDGALIIWYSFFTLTTTGSCAVVFLDDGSILQIAVPGGASTTIAPAGTIAPTVGAPYAFQFGPRFLIIISEQTDGYWIWDGANLFGAGGLAPSVELTDPGFGYTTDPTITVLGGSGSGAVLTPTVVDGAVTKIDVTNPGSGWFVNEHPFLIFTGGGGGDTAYGVVNLDDGVIVSVTLVSGGSGFTSVPAISITDGTGAGASIVVTGVSGGVLTGLHIVAGGAHYTAPVLGTTGGGGSGMIATAALANGVIVGVTMTSSGSGYVGAPTGKIYNQGEASPGGGQITGIVNGTGHVTGGTVTAGGSGYRGLTYVVFSGGSGPAAATVQLMPFGVQGSTGDENNGRVWIASIVNPIKVFFTAPGVDSPQDFNVADGAGVFPPTDSHLQYQYTALKASAGEFLYLIGDSSIDVESGATVSGTPPITTFSKVNVDEQIGTIWRDSVVNYGRAIVFANTFGIHTIYGGAVSKISAPLDGFYSTPTPMGALVPSSAVAEIFGIHVYMCLKTVIDPVTKVQRNLLLMWDTKRWWVASQTAALTLLATREFNSQLEAWGTDNHSIFPLFTTPSTNISKVLLSKLWTKPSIIMVKKADIFYALFEAVGNVALIFSIDTESGSDPVTQGTFTSAGGLTWSFSKTPPAVGHTIGYQMLTNSADFTIVDLTLLGQEYLLRT